MPSNYFSTPSYNPPRVTTPPAVNFDNLPTMPTLPAGLDPSVMGLASAPNYAARNLISGQLGSGGAIANRYKGLIGARRDAAKASTRGFGGINWREDDLSTPQDESLVPVTESDKMGQNERDAYNSALSRGSASGISYSSAGDQLVGAALQRVSEEASKVIAQYAGDINSLATNQLNESNAALNNYMSMYGADAQWVLSQKAPDAPAAVAADAPPEQAIAAGKPVDQSWYNGRTVWSHSTAPTPAALSAYRKRFPAAKGYTVQVLQPAKAGGKYTVKVFYTSQADGSPLNPNSIPRPGGETVGAPKPKPKPRKR